MSHLQYHNFGFFLLTKLSSTCFALKTLLYPCINDLLDSPASNVPKYSSPKPKIFQALSISTIMKH